jgi:hypothetical protein
VTSTTDRTVLDQSVAEPVANVICEKVTTPEAGVGSDCDWRA